MQHSTRTSQVAVLNIDIYKSSLLKASMNQEFDLAEDPGPMAAYHQAIDDLARAHKGQVWLRSGDGVIVMFPAASKALVAAMDLLDAVGEINRKSADRLDGAVLVTRIGMHMTDQSLMAVPPKDRGRVDSADLDLAGKLQKNCPIGRIAASSEAYAAIGFRGPLFRPAMIDEVQDRPIFVLAERLITPQEEALLAGLPASQKRVMPTIPFLSWNRIQPDERLGLRTVSSLLMEPLLIILGESAPERGPMASAGSEAVGIMEALAALPSNPDVRVALDVWPSTGDLVSTHRNVLLVGSGSVNAYAFAINDIMPYLRFVKAEGRITRALVVTSDEEELRLGPDTSDMRDAGFVSVSRSPFNAHQSLIWVAGVNGRATQAAALLLKDLALDAKECLATMGLSGSNPIGCVVVPHIEPMTGDRARDEPPYTKWWSKRYRPIRAVDDVGRSLRITPRRPSAM
jgi:hypothetical protein